MTTLTIRIGGPVVVEKLRVKGDAVLAGTLHLVFTGGYIPALFSCHDFLRVDGELSGAFDTVTITGFDNGGNAEATWRIDCIGDPGYGYRLTCAVVPESNTVVLALLGMMSAGGALITRRCFPGRA